MTLSEYLKTTNLSQAEFGLRIGADQSTVSRYLRGRRRPRWDALRVIAEATGGQVTPADFFDGAEYRDGAEFL